MIDRRFEAEVALLHLIAACRVYKEALRSGDLVAVMHANDEVEAKWSALKAVPVEAEA